MKKDDKRKKATSKEATSKEASSVPKVPPSAAAAQPKKLSANPKAPDMSEGERALLKMFSLPGGLPMSADTFSDTDEEEEEEDLPPPPVAKKKPAKSVSDSPPPKKKAPSRKKKP